jgi:hypothetical protein
MKQLLSLSLAFLLFSFISSDTPVSKKERKTAVNLLKDTEKGVMKSIEGLTDAQLAFKPAEDRWSVEGCLKHIAISEQMLGGMVEAALKAPANPEKRTDIKVADDELIKNIENRTQKVKTMDPMKPENTPYQSAADALASFKENREKLISFMSSTKDDLRNHVVELPFGTYDAYQVILLVGAHSNRHTQQIEEVKADANFPKN